MATYPSLATPEQYAALTGTPVNPDIQPVLDAASALIRRYCGWHISPVMQEEMIVDGAGGHVQNLPTLNLVNLLALEELMPGGTVNVYPPTEVEWSRNGYLRKVGCWTERFQAITATVEHGYDEGDCLDLAMLCATMAARAVASPFGEKQQTVGSVTVALSSGASGAAGGVALYPDQAAQLDAYRLFGRP